MSASVWEEFDPESFQDYLRAWNDPTLLAKLEITDNDAAYHVLAYSGLLARREADGCGLPTSLAQMPSQERVRLVRSACTRMAGFSFDVYYHDLFARDYLDVDQLAEAHELLMQRDEWDAALWMAGKLVDDQLESNEALLADLALSHSVAAAFDEELFKHPDIVAGALYILDDAPENQRIGLWFQRAQEFERQFNDPGMTDVLRAAAEHKDDNNRQALQSTAVSGEVASRPRFVVLLLECSKELAANGAELAIAASDGSKQSERHKELSAFRGTVPGDDSLLRVRFDIARIDENTQELGVFLIGSPSDKRRYREVKISFDDGGYRAVKLERGEATLCVTQHAIEKIAALTFVDAAGEERVVDLDGPAAEGCNEPASDAQKSV